MFGDINNVSLMGNITRDPDLRYTPNGSAVLSFGLATNRRYKKGDEWVDEVSFHNIVIWNGAESLAQRVKKGTRIYIEGRLQTRSWDNAEGQKQYKTEVIADKTILIARYEGSNNDEGSSQSQSFDTEPAAKPARSSSKSAPAAEESDESIDPNDLPF